MINTVRVCLYNWTHLITTTLTDQHAGVKIRPFILPKLSNQNRAEALGAAQDITPA